MYRREFEKLLSQGLPHALLLYGENLYFKEKYLRLYRERVSDGATALSLYYDEYDFERAKSYLSESSLFGDENLLIVRRDRKIPKKELDTLVSLAQSNASNYFVFLFEGEDRDAKPLLSSFSAKSGGVAVRLFPSNTNEGVTILSQEAQRVGLDIDTYALSHLMTVERNDLSLCVKEIEKLAISGEKITGKDIDNQVFGASSLGMEELFTELFDGKSISHTLEKLLELGEDENTIMRSLQRFTQQIFMFNAYARLYGRPDSKEILGYKLPRELEERRASIALRLSPAVLLRIYDYLLKSDIEMKRSSGVCRESLLYGTFVGLQSLMK